MPMAITVKPEDIRKIRISCRCGTKSIAEVPIQLSRMVNVHICPKCHRSFGIQGSPDTPVGDWKVKSVDLGQGMAIRSGQFEQLEKEISGESEEVKEPGKMKWKN